MNENRNTSTMHIYFKHSVRVIRVHDNYKDQVDICICYSVDGANLFFRISINFLLIVSKSELFDCD